MVVASTGSEIRPGFDPAVFGALRRTAASQIGKELRVELPPEDAAQSALLRAHRHVGDWSLVTLRLARHHLQHVLAEAARRRTVSAAAISAAAISAAAISAAAISAKGTVESPVDARLQLKELIVQLRVAGVPREDLLALRLLARRFTEKQAAKKLGLSYGALRRRLTRLRLKLDALGVVSRPRVR